MAKRIIMIKLGGSLITDKSRAYHARPAVIRRLAREIKSAWNEGYRFLISHGSGSFGHTSASKYKTAEGIKRKSNVYGLAVVQQDAFRLNRIVNEVLVDVKLPCLTFVPGSFSFANNKKLSKQFFLPILRALEIGSLPLVFGDIILDQEKGCCIFSGETVLDNLVKPLQGSGYKIEKIIQVGITDGVYNSKGKTISLIYPQSLARISKAVSGSETIDVTGGMAHKIGESLKIARQGVDTIIVNGGNKGSLLKAILGKKVNQTLVTASRKR